MSPHTIPSSSVHQHGTLIFVGHPTLASRVAGRHEGATTQTREVRVQAFGSGTVSVAGHALKPLAARALAGLLERAAQHDQPGQVSGVSVTVPHDGVITLRTSTGDTLLDGQGALDLAELITRAATAVERRATPA